MKHLLLCLNQEQICTAFHLVTERFVSSMSPVCEHCTWMLHRLYDNAVSIAHVTSLVAREKSLTYISSKVYSSAHHNTEAFQSQVIYTHFVPTASKIQCFILLSLKHNYKHKTPQTALNIRVKLVCLYE